MKNVINARLFSLLGSFTDRERERQGELNWKARQHQNSMTISKIRLFHCANIPTSLSAFSSPSKIKAAITLLTPASVKHRLPGPGKISASETKISQERGKSVFDRVWELVESKNISWKLRKSCLQAMRLNCSFAICQSKKNAGNWWPHKQMLQTASNHGTVSKMSPKAGLFLLKTVGVKFDSIAKYCTPNMAGEPYSDRTPAGHSHDGNGAHEGIPQE